MTRGDAAPSPRRCEIRLGSGKRSRKPIVGGEEGLVLRIFPVSDFSERVDRVTPGAEIHIACGCEIRSESIVVRPTPECVSKAIADDRFTPCGIVARRDSVPVGVLRLPGPAVNVRNCCP